LYKWFLKYNKVTVCNRMSCFAGKLKEYPSFSVDCFDKNNLDSDVYFLSHCHQGTSDTVILGSLCCVVRMSVYLLWSVLSKIFAISTNGLMYLMIFSVKFLRNLTVLWWVGGNSYESGIRHNSVNFPGGVCDLCL
jgi:hypothetical protein